MEKIPQALIDEIPTEVTADRDSCEATADSALLVLFIGGSRPLPPILSSTGVEVWPLPPPYSDAEEDQDKLLQNLNGGGTEPHSDESGLLDQCIRNANEYNAALDTSDLPLAKKISEQMSKDSASMWSWCNALAKTVETASVYRTLELSDETKEAYETA